MSLKHLNKVSIADADWDRPQLRRLVERGRYFVDAEKTTKMAPV